MTPDKQAGLRPVVTSLYPTMGSLQEVIDHAKAQLPITNENTLVTILMTFQNTLLHLQEQDNDSHHTSKPAR